MKYYQCQVEFKCLSFDIKAKTKKDALRKLKNKLRKKNPVNLREPGRTYIDEI